VGSVGTIVISALWGAFGGVGIAFLCLAIWADGSSFSETKPRVKDAPAGVLLLMVFLLVIAGAATVGVDIGRGEALERPAIVVTPTPEVIE
jgi:hypothetical protein